MDKFDIREILAMPLEKLVTVANSIRRGGTDRCIEICSIINARSGMCGEDCKFCAQSAHYHTDVKEYSLKSGDEIITAARKAAKNGAKRFGIVTSGRRLTRTETEVVAETVRKIRKNVNIQLCASLGALCGESLVKLKNAGLMRYHHNVETSERFYPAIVSTHGYSERINTIRNAKKAGLEICSGGIFGMGETWQDRLDMALLLKKLDVDSVPLNFLIPVKGTPLESAGEMSPEDAIRVIALFRIVLRDKAIIVVAGRESVLKDFQALMFSAGANGMMVGGYLTVSGRPPDVDRVLIEEIQDLWDRE